MANMQTEKPGITPEQLEAVTGSNVKHVSGGQYENFREGWAKAIMNSGKKAHYFKREGFDNAESLCGVESPIRWLYGMGTWPKCKKCIAAWRGKP